MEHDEGGLEPGQVVSWPPQGGEEIPAEPTTPLSPEVRARIDKVFGKPGGPAKPKEPAAVEPVAKEPTEEKPLTEEKPRQPINSAPYALQVPEFIPVGEQTDERVAMLEDFATVAPAAGLTPERSQGMVEAMVDAATMIDYVPPDTYTTASDAFEELQAQFGEDATDIATQAQRFVAASPPALKEYLERTGLGNNVGALYILALAQNGVFEFTPEQAQQHLDEYRADPESYYYSKNEQERRQALLEMQILARIAEGKPVNLSDEIAREAKKGNIGPRPESTPNAIAASQAELRREAAELVNPKSKLFRGNAAEKAAAKARFSEITAKL